MKITKIKILKNSVSVYFDDEKLELDKEVYPNFYLYVGKEVSKKEYKKIKEFNDISSLLKYALKIRSKAIYSEYQMREKLYAKGGNKEEIDQVINKLKSYDLIDDNAFIEDHIEYYNSLNYGKNKILNKLSEKGIFEERLEKINFPISIERKKAKSIFDKLDKKHSKYNFVRKKQHIYNSYISLGFSKEIANEMVSTLKEDNNKEEKKKLEKDFEKIKTRYSNKYQKKELKQKILQALLQKGYRMNDILPVIERMK